MQALELQEAAAEIHPLTIYRRDYFTEWFRSIFDPSSLHRGAALENDVEDDVEKENWSPAKVQLHGLQEEAKAKFGVSWSMGRVSDIAASKLAAKRIMAAPVTSTNKMAALRTSAGGQVPGSAGMPSASKAKRIRSAIGASGKEEEDEEVFEDDDNDKEQDGHQQQHPGRKQDPRAYYAESDEEDLDSPPSKPVINKKSKTNCDEAGWGGAQGGGGGRDHDEQSDGEEEDQDEETSVAKKPPVLFGLVATIMKKAPAASAPGRGGARGGRGAAAAGGRGGAAGAGRGRGRGGCRPRPAGV